MKRFRIEEERRRWQKQTNVDVELHGSTDTPYQAGKRKEYERRAQQIADREVAQQNFYRSNRAKGMGIIKSWLTARAQASELMLQKSHGVASYSKRSGSKPNYGKRQHHKNWNRNQRR